MTAERETRRLQDNGHLSAADHNAHKALIITVCCQCIIIALLGPLQNGDEGSLLSAPPAWACHHATMPPCCDSAELPQCQVQWLWDKRSRSSAKRSLAVWGVAGKEAGRCVKTKNGEGYDLCHCFGIDNSPGSNQPLHNLRMAFKFRRCQDKASPSVLRWNAGDGVGMQTERQVSDNWCP